MIRSQTTAYSIAFPVRQLATVPILLAILHGPAFAQNDEFKGLLNCLSDSSKCSPAERNAPRRRPKAPVYESTASDAPSRPIARYAKVVDDQSSVSDCVIDGMRGVSSDAAASMVRTACENKSRAHKRDRDMENQREYGPSVSDSQIEVTPSRKAGGVSDRLIISNVRGRPDAIITYVSFNVISMTKSGQCDGADMRLAYKVTLPAQKSIELQIPGFYPAESPGVCATVVEVKAKPSTWSDSLKNLTSVGEVAPLKVDPFP